jgi:hypothetical protein
MIKINKIRYEPKIFTELLSDDRINREVLMWLKKWGQF